MQEGGRGRHCEPASVVGTRVGVVGIDGGWSGCWRGPQGCTLGAGVGEFEAGAYDVDFEEAEEVFCVGVVGDELADLVAEVGAGGVGEGLVLSEEGPAGRVFGKGLRGG